MNYRLGLIDRLLDVESVASLSNACHRNEDYMIGEGRRPLTISNVIVVKGKEGLVSIIDGRRRSEELKDDTLPNRCLGWTFKEVAIDGIIYCGAHYAHWRQVGRRKHAL